MSRDERAPERGPIGHPRTLNLSCGKCGAVISVRAKDVEWFQIDAAREDDADEQHVTCPFHEGLTYWMFATEEPL